MRRKVYLDGELADRYGKELTVSGTSFAEIFKCLDCNFPDFRSYLIECQEKGIGFVLELAEAPITDEKELIMEFQEGDMFISPQPAGAKGAVKVIAAIVIAVLIVTNPAGWAIAAGSLTTAGAVAAGVAVSLAISGLAEMMAPDPSTDSLDSTQNKSYLFQGSGQVIEEGDPVPVVYGKLRIPGRLVSFDVRNEKAAYIDTGFSSISSNDIGNIYTGDDTAAAAASSPPTMYLPGAPGTLSAISPTESIGSNIIFKASDVLI